MLYTYKGGLTAKDPDLEIGSHSEESCQFIPNPGRGHWRPLQTGPGSRGTLDRDKQGPGPSRIGRLLLVLCESQLAELRSGSQANETLVTRFGPETPTGLTSGSLRPRMSHGFNDIQIVVNS